MKQRRYNNARWLAKPVEAFWEETERMKWQKFYNECVSSILNELDLLEDETALSLAKNLWHSAREGEDVIKKELLDYKELRKVEEDVRKMIFVGVGMN